ncbi:ribonuclease P protein component [Proteinivorax hydrogeniformans]|uniref:Ribonuclease P protein component n=1 Tax=Proteinivorax hydrogeniformans TaxID=1826727 RepID=A0AAU8HT59_9FIRM
MANFLPLKKDSEFRHIYKVGFSKATKHLVVYCIKNDDNNRLPRIGFVASKKIGNAVVRNRYRRLMKEALKTVNEFSGYDLIVLARPRIVKADFKTICKDVNFLLKRQNIFR